MGVRYVLEGSVQKAGDRVRITVQLIDALKGNHMWSESYDRELEDIFALQDDISMEVVTAMRVKLSEGEQARLMRKGTKNLKAYLKLLEGVEQSNLLNKEANLRTRQLYEEAIELEPEYGAAYGLLGLSHLVDVLFGWSNSPAESLQKAYELSQKTLSLDDSLPIPYRTISDIYLLQKEHEKAIANAQRAVELSPNAAAIIFNLGWILRCAGRPEEGIPFLEKAVRLDPIPHDYQLDSLGRAYFLTGRYEEAIAAYKKAIAANPDWRDAHVGLASSYAILGQWDEARAEVSEILRIEPNFSIGKYEKYMFHQTGLETEIEGLRKAGLPE
jgi:adenylate cyclase